MVAVAVKTVVAPSHTVVAGVEIFTEGVTLGLTVTVVADEVEEHPLALKILTE